MHCHPSNRLHDVFKEDLQEEIKYALSFLDWLSDRIEARSMDKDKGILNILLDIEEAQEEYVDLIQTEYTKKYC